ncbi:hypothetical protein OEA41_004650 [Lepraria neglecta]|uniref:Uncharacterized protein n=1 Tax=Lepraria neglecta TaxID=209136 RepID=A0AAE0DG23_9LECA|nr:hypothetical protein OEA41_004650 [Lepraria neglecta]
MATVTLFSAPISEEYIYALVYDTQMHMTSQALIPNDGSSISAPPKIDLPKIELTLFHLQFFENLQKIPPKDLYGDIPCILWLRVTALLPLSARISYCVGKNLAVKAIWKFVEEEKPSYTVTNFLPALIFEPPLQQVRDLKKLNFSKAKLYSRFDGANKVVSGTTFPAYASILDK